MSNKEKLSNFMLKVLSIFFVGENPVYCQIAQRLGSRGALQVPAFGLHGLLCHGWHGDRQNDQRCRETIPHRWHHGQKGVHQDHRLCIKWVHWIIFKKFKGKLTKFKLKLSNYCKAKLSNFKAKRSNFKIKMSNFK